MFFYDSFFKIYCGGASLEDRTVCQLTQDLVEFYHLLYSEPRFPSQEALDRPLFFVSLSLSLTKNKNRLRVVTESFRESFMQLREIARVKMWPLWNVTLLATVLNPRF